MSRTFFVVGPTSVGKSRVALEIAERCGGEIVNADAFQIYDGLELLTSRPGAEERRRVPHHLFGIVPLIEPFNVARYLTEANHSLQDIHRRGRVAIVVGGTGLYIKALTHGLSPLPAADPQLRVQLESLPFDDLVRKLTEIDPVAVTQVDLKNPRRIVRALEVCLVTGKPFSSFRDTWNTSIYGPGEAGIFLDRERDDLRHRIEQQVDRIFAAGVIEEVRAVTGKRVGETAAGVIGLSEIQTMLAGAISRDECVGRIKIRTKQYAKRQVTWFKREEIFRRLLLSGDETQSVDVFK